MNCYEVEYFDGDERLIGYVAAPEDLISPAPVVMISHMWSGRVSFVEEKAREMAAQGYIGFALDMYGEAKVGQSVEENTALMMPFMQDREKMQRRMQLAYSALDQIAYADLNKVVAMGYCFGGLCVQDLARVNSEIQGVISVHGLMKRPDNINQGKFDTKVLLLHGADDPMVSDQEWHDLRNELNSAQCDWQKHDFGGVMHAFTNPEANDTQMGTVFNANANQRSNQLISDFIKECMN